MGGQQRGRRGSTEHKSSMDAAKAPSLHPPAEDREEWEGQLSSRWDRGKGIWQKGVRKVRKERE
jgi:hypothetical protein